MHQERGCWFKSEQGSWYCQRCRVTEGSQSLKSGSSGQSVPAGSAGMISCSCNCQSRNVLLRCVISSFPPKILLGVVSLYDFLDDSGHFWLLLQKSSGYFWLG